MSGPSRALAVALAVAALVAIGVLGRVGGGAGRRGLIQGNRIRDF